jgi:hypothetical protein
MDDICSVTLEPSSVAQSGFEALVCYVRFASTRAHADELLVYLLHESGDIGAPQNEILRVSPRIRGPRQVAGRNESFSSDRVRTDVHYVRNWSIWLDLVILARTAGSTMLRRGAYWQVWPWELMAGC